MILMFLLDLAVILLVGYLLWRYVTVPIAGVIRRRMERTSAQGPKSIRPRPSSPTRRGGRMGRMG